MTRVVVSRARLAQWWPRPWAEVIDAAERGEDGLRVVQFARGRIYRPRVDNDFAPGWDDWDDIVFLREGRGEIEDDDWGRNRTLLYQQNF